MPNPRVSSSRRRVYEVLEVAAPGDLLSRVVDLSLIVMVAINIGAVIFESVEPLYRAHRVWFEVLENVSVSIFTVEYFLRVWSAPERAQAGVGPWRARWRWMTTPLALADFGAILPVFLMPLVGSDLRFLRVMRLARVFKLTRYYGSLTLVLEVVSAQRRAYGACLFVLLVVLVIAASGIYLAEHRAQPVAFGSIPAAMWWALVTLTTVGYGDVTPITGWGKLFAACVTVVGVGVVALPTGILASGFLDAYQRNRERLSAGAARAAADGYISGDEAVEYGALAERLGIVPEVAQEIMAAAERGVPHWDACPHCGKDLRDS